MSAKLRTLFRGVLPASAFLLLLAAAAPAQDARFESVSRFVTEKMKELDIPGAALGIFHQGASQTRAFGVTSVENALPVTDETLFQIGSISKTYTGTLIMRLVEMGKLKLDEPVRTYIPSFRVKDETAARSATVKTLLTHMGGWEGDLFLDTGGGEDAVARAVERMAEIEQVAPFNTFYSYNNAGFYAAARLIELAAGKPYEKVLEELLLEPLGLKQTFLSPADVMTRRFAVGHGGAVGRVTVQRPWALSRAAYAMGAVTASVKDLLQYGRFHLGEGAGVDGKRVLAPDTLAQMHATQFVKQGMDDEMAISWHVSNEGGIRQLSHGGSTVGQQAFLVFVPSHQFAVAVLTNSGRGSQMYREAVRAAMKEYLGVTITDPAPITVAPEEMRACEGRYTRPYADATVKLEGERLAVQTITKQGFPTPETPIPPPGPPSFYRFYAKDRLVAVEGPARGSRAEILRNPDGSIGWIRIGGRLYRTAAR